MSYLSIISSTWLWKGSFSYSKSPHPHIDEYMISFWPDSPIRRPVYLCTRAECDRSSVQTMIRSGILSCSPNRRSRKICPNSCYTCTKLKSVGPNLKRWGFFEKRHFDEFRKQLYGERCVTSSLTHFTCLCKF